MRNGTSPPMAGTWRITFSGTQVGAGTATHSVVTGEDGNDMTVVAVNSQPPPGRTTQILTDVSSARRVITVASYNIDYAWMTLSGEPSSTATPLGAVGDLSTFSSRGPRRMCSNPVKCPQIMKPEITAPGAMIKSTLASDQPAAAGPTTVLTAFEFLYQPEKHYFLTIEPAEAAAIDAGAAGAGHALASIRLPVSRSCFRACRATAGRQSGVRGSTEMFDIGQRHFLATRGS